jgi:hypothetical protein
MLSGVYMRISLQNCFSFFLFFFFCANPRRRNAPQSKRCSLTISVHCMQIDRRGRRCACVVVGYDRCRAKHEVQWTVKTPHDTRGRGNIRRDWVDFATDIVHKENVRRRMIDEQA